MQKQKRCDTFFALVGALPLVLLVFAGCATSPEPPDLGDLYNRSAQHHGPDRNPIIVIPGIMGSRLVDGESGTVIWGAFGGDSANPSKPAGARLCALPMKRGVPLDQLRDKALVDGSLDRLKVQLLFIPIELNAYLNILGTLGVGGYRDQQLGMAGAIDYGDDHYTCFQFAYDWRRSNVENARLLGEYIEEKREYVQEQLEQRYGVSDHNVKFDIVAHSMGGLITRYYLRYGDQPLPSDGSLPTLTWDGCRYVERAILVGTPSAGSLFALDTLVNGLKTPPTLPNFPSTILGTFPSIYELLPRARHGALVNARNPAKQIDFLDPQAWQRMGWGLADPGEARTLKTLLPDVEDEQERRAIANDQLQKSLTRAKRFHAALDVSAKPPAGTELYLIAGDSEPTPTVFSADPQSGALQMVESGPGDGTVIRQSALMDERMGGNWSPRVVTPVSWSRVTFLFNDHIGMTMDPMFTDNILYVLLEEPRP